MAVSLSKEQQDAHVKIRDFLNSSKKWFPIYGCAGTGKTWFVTYIIGREDMSKFDKIYFIAPTNKAVNVLLTKNTENIDFTKTKFLTIDKFLGTNERIDKFGYTYFSPNGLTKITYGDNYKTRKDYYVSNKHLQSVENYDILSKELYESNSDTTFNKYTLDYNIFEGHCAGSRTTALIIIDEISMISTDKWSFIKNFTGNSKIILLGDINQLSPVKDKQLESIVFEEIDNDVIDCHSKINFTEIQRNKDPNLGKIYNKLRKTIDLARNILLNGKNYNLSNEEKNCLKKLVSKNITKFKNINDLNLSLKSALETEIDFMFLNFNNTNTNENVNSHNENLIKIINETKENYFGYYLNSKYIFTNYYNNINTGTEFKIIEINYYKEKKEYVLKIEYQSYNKKEKRVTVQTNNLKILEEDEYDKRVGFQINKRNKYKALYKKNNTNKLTKKDRLEFNDIMKDIDNEIEKYLEFKKNKAQITAKYPNKLELILLLLNQDIKKYIKKGEEPFKLDYMNTVHKAQGSTYEKVYVNVYNIINERNFNHFEMLKLLYVAVSRPSESLELVDIKG
jgi:hypothetical protein